MVSLAPLFGWKDENWIKRVDEGECMVILNIETKSEFFNKGRVQKKSKNMMEFSIIGFILNCPI